MGEGHSTSRIMELVTQSGPPDLQLGSSSAWPPQSSPKSWTVVKALLCPAQQQAKRPQEGKGCLSAALVGSVLRALSLGGFLNREFSNPDSVPGSTQGFCRHVVVDWTSHSDWRQAAQFNPEKMETAVL